MTVRTAVVVAGGDAILPSALDELPDPVWVVAADSGLDHALAIGLRVDYLVGDLDSVSPAALDQVSVPIERHPSDKDATDLELALRAVASRSQIERVIVLGGLGGRLDHLLANAALLTSEAWAHLDVEWIAGSARSLVVRDHARLYGVPGEPVSLIPLGGPASGVFTEGLRWTLLDGTLTPGTTLGVSNELARSVASVKVGAGSLLVVQPEAVPSESSHRGG